ncbi:hypothetical protein BDR04DRAFT_181719 [Suillus decipiens]|nr:hypothetical protein BDR04DRAFT_181719 [Suillus decipiens]
MPSPFHWLERLGKVIVLRLKRPIKQGRTQDNSTTVDHEGDASIRTDLPNPVPPPMFASSSSSVHPVSASSEPGLEEFHNGFPPSAYPFNASPAREASDIAQVALPLLQAVTGVIPLAGTPINAAISPSQKCDQNKAAVDDLISRLGRLSQHLSNAPPASDPLEPNRRDVLTRKLQDTSARLRKLPKHRLPYPSVTQAITGCSTDINNYLAEYSFSCQMQDRCEIREVHELLITLQRRLEDRNIEPFVASSASHLPATVMTGCVTLVDATGHHHQISVNLCTSYQQFNDMLRVLFQRDLIEAQIQRRYIEEGKYDLCIDQGTSC